jgi:hypothetical protein
MGNMLWPASIARCSYESTLENLVPNLQTIHDAHACAHDLEYVRAVSGTSAYIKSSKLTAMANHHSLIVIRHTHRRFPHQISPSLLLLGHTRTYAQPAVRCTRCRPIVADAADRTRRCSYISTQR